MHAPRFFTFCWRFKLSRIASIALLIWISFYSAPVAASAAAPVDLIQTVSPYRSTASWDIEDRWFFLVSHSCNTDEIIFGFWPADPVCAGRVETYRRNKPSDNPDSIDAYLQGNIVDSDNKIRALRGASEDISVNGQWGTPSRMYDSIVELNDPVASFRGRPYRLSEFKERVDGDLRVSRENATAKVRDMRSEWLTTILAGVALFFSALLALWIIYRIGKRFLPALVESSARKSKSALGELRNMHVRHVAVDEAIRAATRAALDNTQKERAELRTQIAQAIDTGNPELAKTLMSLLQKLEGDTANI